MKRFAYGNTVALKGKWLVCTFDEYLKKGLIVLLRKITLHNTKITKFHSESNFVAGDVL